MKILKLIFYFSQLLIFFFFFLTEESLAHKVCLLLIELYLVTEQPDSALSILNYVESQFISMDSSKLCVDKESVIKSVKTEQKEQKKDINDIANNIFKIKLLKCKARIYLLTHQLKLCKKEWKTLVSLGTPVVMLFIVYLSLFLFLCVCVVICKIVWLFSEQFHNYAEG